MAIKQKMTFQCQGGSSYILKSNRRSRKSSPWRAKACDAPQMPHVAGSRGRWGGGLAWGWGLAPPSPDLQATAQWNATPAAAPGWPAPTARRPILSASAPPTSAPPEPHWKTAHKLKEISFQQTSLWRIRALSSPSRMSVVHFTS